MDSINKNHAGPVNGIKRARVTKSCTICRQKKIKCDKTKPVCESCLKKGRSHLCQYEEPEWNVNTVGGNGNGKKKHTPNPAVYNGFNDTTPTAVELYQTSSVDGQLLAMQEKLKQIEAALHKPSISNNGASTSVAHSQTSTRNSFPRAQSSNSSITSSNIGAKQSLPSMEDEFIIDFYKNNYGKPRMISQGVLSWVTMLKKDVYLNAIVESCRRRKIIVLTKSQEGRSTASEKDFISKFKDEQDLDADLKTSREMEDIDACKYRTKDMVTTIKAFLKDAKLIWLLVDKFFESELYYLLPLVERDHFIGQLTDIIGSRESNKITLKITKKLQLCTIGILSVIMRLSSLSLYNGIRLNGELSELDQYIWDNKIKKEFSNLTQRCFDEISRFRESSLDIFQFQLFMRYYSLLSPEECDCVNIGTAADMGPLLHSAVSTGLNRDPKITGSGFQHPNLLRRLWFKVLYLDMNQMMHTGCPPIVNERFYDTLPPSLNSNSSASEYYINEMMLSRAELHDICRPLLMLILDVREAPKLAAVRHLLKPLETYYCNLPKWDSIMNMPSDTVIQRTKKIGLTCSLSDVISLLYMIYYHFYLFYNELKIKEQHLFYFIERIKLMKFAMPLVRFLLDEKDGGSDFDLRRHFGTGMIVIPKMELNAHKCIQLLFSIMSRVKGTKAVLKLSDPIKLRILDEIHSRCVKISNILLKAFANISDVYYHPWAMNKMHSFIAKQVLHNEPGPFNAEAPMTQTDEQYMRSLKSVPIKDDLFSELSNEDLKLILDQLDELEVSCHDSTNASPVSSVDLSFNNAENNAVDLIWFNQLQHEQQQMNGAMFDLPESNTISPVDYNSVPTSNGGNANNMVQNPAPNWDLYDIERFFYQTSSDSFLGTLNFEQN